VTVATAKSFSAAPPVFVASMVWSGGFGAFGVPVKAAFVALSVMTAAVTTETVAVAAWPSDVAVIVAEPVVTPLTKPAESTVATAVLLELQAVGMPTKATPSAFRATAISRTVSAITTSVVPGTTVSAATAPGPMVVSVTQPRASTAARAERRSRRTGVGVTGWTGCANRRGLFPAARGS